MERLVSIFFQGVMEFPGGFVTAVAQWHGFNPWPRNFHMLCVWSTIINK